MSKIILVIDDDRLMRDLIEAILKNDNLKIIKAENGIVGCNLAKEYLPDLIICDLMMPKLNGYDVLKIIRHNSDTHHIPFIVLTSIREKASKDLVQELGGNDYLIKNMDLKRLPEIVSKHLLKQ